MVGAKAGWSSRISFLSGFGLLTSSFLQTPVFPQQSSMENFSKLLLFLAFKFDSHVFLSLGKSLVFFQYFFFFLCLGIKVESFFHQRSKRQLQLHRQFPRMLVLWSVTRKIRCVIQLAFIHIVGYHVGAKGWVCVTGSTVKVSADTGSVFYTALSLPVFN